MTTLTPDERDRVALAAKSRRESRGISQVRLAKLAGVSPGTVGAFESGKPVQATKRALILNAIGLQLDTSGRAPRLVDAEPSPDDANLLTETVLVMMRAWLDALPEEKRGGVLDRLASFMLSETDRANLKT